MSESNSAALRLIKCAEYIEANSHERISLAALADKAAMSQFHFQRKFSDLFGVSPKQFQSAIRVQKLKESLKAGDDVTSAIYEAGFGSSSRIYEQVNTSIGMKPSAYKKGGEFEEISFSMRQTFIGKIIMAATNRGVCFVHIGDSYSQLLYSLYQEFPSATLTATPQKMESDLDNWMHALEMHLAMNKKLPNIPLHLKGTTFQINVWRFLTSIKEGETVSYSKVAQSIGKPKAFRAVANACGANNLAILIPCHRVLRGDGSQGGYRWGTSAKGKLLDLEAMRSSM